MSEKYGLLQIQTIGIRVHRNEFPKTLATFQYIGCLKSTPLFRLNSSVVKSLDIFLFQNNVSTAAETQV